MIVEMGLTASERPWSGQNGLTMANEALLRSWGGVSTLVGGDAAIVSGGTLSAIVPHLPSNSQKESKKGSIAERDKEDTHAELSFDVCECGECGLYAARGPGCVDAPCNWDAILGRLRQAC
jgi:hypothetical protein